MPSFPAIWRQSICAASGGMAGGIAGVLFGIAQRAQGSLPVLAALKAGLLLGLVAWLALLIVVGVWLHYGVRAVAGQTFVTAFLASIATVLIANALGVPLLDVWLGLVLGTLIGAALCRMCKQLEMQRGV